MLSEFGLTEFSGTIAGIGFSANELLLHQYVIHMLQCLNVAGQISVGHIKQFFQSVEIGTIVHHKDRHDPQTNSMIEQLIYIIDESHVQVFFSFSNIILP